MELSALYLPQFHEIPENNQMWGPGFTEWTNVKKAEPLFHGHEQPVAPGELGYYSLLDPFTRDAQAALAREYGVTSFCYWHYWFGNGRQVLERPLNEVISTGRPDFPFLVGWANHSWSGKWSGDLKRVVLKQEYPEGGRDDRDHFAALLQAFRDSRYVKRNGKPVFIVFDPKGLPNAKRFVDTWQKLAFEAGLPGLYLVAWIQGKSGFVRYRHHEADGFDAGLYVNLPVRRSLVSLSREAAQRHWLRFGPVIYEARAEPPEPFVALKGVIHPCVWSNWDNTPRSSRRGSVVKGLTPERIEEHLRQALTGELVRADESQFVVIKSWNEWAEGNYIEPDLKYGRRRLEAVRSARLSVGLR